MTKQVVYRGKIEVHLSRKLRLESFDLQLEDNETPEAQVVEEQVEVEVLPADLERILAADEREALAQLEDERANLLNEPLFERALSGLRREREEVKRVGILDELLRQLGLLGGQSTLEVGERAALPIEQAVFDLMNEDVAAPAVLDRLAHIPFALNRALHSVEQMRDVAPGAIVQQLLHNCFVGPRLGEGPHVLEAAGRNSSHFRERAP